MSRKTGGPAFPNNAVMCETKYADGMTLRDYFAVHATEEDMRSAAQDWMSKGKAGVCDRATARYHHADLMLKEREK